MKSSSKADARRRDRPDDNAAEWVSDYWHHERATTKWVPWDDTPTVLSRVCESLREHADYQRNQHCDNSDRSYRIRNVRTGSIVPPKHLRVLFGFNDGAACSRPMTKAQLEAPTYLAAPARLRVES